jgi:hypothetical protein
MNERRHRLYTQEIPIVIEGLKLLLERLAAKRED